METLLLCAGLERSWSIWTEMEEKMRQEKKTEKSAAIAPRVKNNHKKSCSFAQRKISTPPSLRNYELLQPRAMFISLEAWKVIENEGKADIAFRWTPGFKDLGRPTEVFTFNELRERDVTFQICQMGKRPPPIKAYTAMVLLEKESKYETKPRGPGGVWIPEEQGLYREILWNEGFAHPEDPYIRYIQFPVFRLSVMMESFDEWVVEIDDHDAFKAECQHPDVTFHDTNPLL